MSTDIKTELKIPDLWFDFYARFLPGTLFVAAVYMLWPGDANVPSGLWAAILALGGYCVGLMVQPLSSELTGLVHNLIAWLVTRDKYYVLKQEHLDPLRILSKMHGEATFFVQCFFLGIALLILQKTPSFQLESTGKTVIATFIFFIFALAMAVDVAWRRVRRAKFLSELAG